MNVYRIEMNTKSKTLKKQLETEGKKIIFGKHKNHPGHAETTTKTTTLTKSGRIGLTALIKIIDEKSG